MYQRMTTPNHAWTSERIKNLRQRYGERQEDFCKRFRISLGALRIWEQGQGEPSGPATIILDQLEADLEKIPATNGHAKSKQPA